MSKKLISTLALFLGIMAYSQVTIGLRANALFNTSSAKWKDIESTATNAWENKGDNSAGFNIGLAAKIGSPVGGWFVMPEVYYTTFKNSLTVDDVTVEAKSNRIDVPVLVGHNFLLGKLAAFVGPVASYNLSSKKTYDDFKVNAENEFTVGYQFGAQATLSKFVINARYEGAFSKDTRNVIDAVSGDYVVRYDNRPSMFIVGIGYNF
ncbi:outer membrane beta-barrel protein [Epilithonimonas mollis]|uniref:Outer membrane protein beta-barrel domain-containing protein n=1 Tax=Epilithonimonas mollis TaxID=216903 RepID=A0A1M6Q4I9_9FLAO|nr:outer membrane beta-barrel protein [Epilithonimonas mollis]SHK15184.1 Outer membrane protein beta-barrel domain-containing protein [Epilithonimonas mollis]